MTNHKVRVYSTPTCPWCHKTKEWLKEKNIEFEDINVAEDQKAAAEMVEATGQRGVPVIQIDDNYIVGYDVAKMKELLEMN